MYILGLNAFHGDSAACLFRDDQLILAIEEERFRRIKHWAGFPTLAIKACLDEAGIGLSELDHIAISRDPYANLLKKVQHSLLRLKRISSLRDRVANSRKVASVKSILAAEFGVAESDLRAPVAHIEHHRAHMGSTFFASPFDKAAILSIDGFGDFSSTMTGVGSGNRIQVFQAVHYPHSVGALYTAFTQYLGFMNYGDEYKVMGLAPYGDARYLSDFDDIVHLLPNGLFRLNQKYFRHSREGVSMSWDGGYPVVGKMFSSALEAKFGPTRQKEEPLTQHHKDLAASLQRKCEQVIFHILESLHRKTGIENLCVAGGVAQNSVANGKMYLSAPFRNIYIPPAATDAGTSIGSALYLYNQLLGKPRMAPLFRADLGSAFVKDDIEQTLAKAGLSYEILPDVDIYEQVSDCLIAGGVVGWFQGRAEFGPRALGYRSILADPRRADAKEILNLKIKKRESFRPFAPSVLAEHAGTYFELDKPVPFMEKVFVIKPEKRADIPAVTHVDGTGRLQTVDKNVSPKYYALIHRFYEKTGVPLVLNTSFNENEPIVNSPAEAADCFLRTKMDMLVLENYVVRRS